MAEHVSLLFGLNLKFAQKKLRIFCQEKYLNKIKIPTTKVGKSPNLFYPGKKTEAMFCVQSVHPRLNSKTSHALKNIDLLIQIKIACQKADIECALLPEHIMRVAGLEVIPDGAFMLQKNNKAALFLCENDSGSEILKSQSFCNEDIENKIFRYEEMFNENQVDFFNQFFSQQFNRFRVLMITSNFIRLIHISSLLQDDKYNFIWLTTLQKFYKKGVLGNIWQTNNQYGLSIVG